MTLDELRLARAQAALRVQMVSSGLRVDEDHVEIYWRGLSKYQTEIRLEMEKAREAADAALGVVSVPVVATLDMSDAFESACADGCIWPELWDVILAASPLREKLDEQ